MLLNDGRALRCRWASALSASGATLVDAAPGLAYLLATKDEAEVRNPVARGIP